jgi:hypothetical protein
LSDTQPCSSKREQLEPYEGQKVKEDQKQQACGSRHGSEQQPEMKVDSKLKSGDIIRAFVVVF